jgi:hypothetical protein
VLSVTDIYILILTALAGVAVGSLIRMSRRRGRSDGMIVDGYVGELRQYVSSFGDFIMGNSIHIPYIYQKAVDQHGVSELREATSTPLEEVRTLYLQLAERVRKLGQPASYVDFIELLGEFNTLVHVYHRVCVIRPARWIFPLVSEKGSTVLLSEFMMLREKYQRWIDDFSSYLKRVNDSLGTLHFSNLFDPVPIP